MNVLCFFQRISIVQKLRKLIGVRLDRDKIGYFVIVGLYKNKQPFPAQGMTNEIEETLIPAVGGASTQAKLNSNFGIKARLCNSSATQHKTR